jgi:hypothetical protein
MDNQTRTAHGILQPEHLDALRQFWEYAKTHPRQSSPAGERVAYVLPTDFGASFRGPNDWVWGLWKNETVSNQIWSDINRYMQQYGEKLDIVYVDSSNSNMQSYSQLFYWNGTVQTKP